MSRRRRMRKTQLIVPFGVGAIVDFPHESLMHAGIDAWEIDDETQVSDDRMARRLGVKRFYEPIPAKEKGQSVYGEIPFVRFPLWHHCPRCGYMKKLNWSSINIPLCDSDSPFCKKIPDRLRPMLVPVRFVVVCKHGHIEDFPWIQWAHTKHGSSLNRTATCSNPVLKLTATGKAGLIGITVKCETCKLKRSMAGSSSPDTLKDYGCSGDRPWLGPDSAQKCHSVNAPRVVQRGATNVYFAQTKSSILIPPYSNKVRRLIGKEKMWDFIMSGDLDSEGLPSLDRVETFAFMHKVKSDEVFGAIKNKLVGDKNDDTQLSEEDYRYSEYRAFLGDDVNDENDDLNIFSQDMMGYKDGLDRYFKNIVLVEKLTETRVLTGFTRLAPPDSESNDNVYLAQLSKGKTGWLPAVRAYGEGVFITLKQDMINQWSSKKVVNNRLSPLLKQYKKTRDERGLSVRDLDNQFILLHSLAHLLIRRLSFECGYGSSSLKERIYSRHDGEDVMFGILIYTAASDSEGTLGGLVQQGKAGHFENILRAALVDATHCSSDPLCGESKGQGSDSLNLASCHACGLLPETSCEEGNRLLDRLCVVGTADNPELGFFGDYVKQMLQG